MRMSEPDNRSLNDAYRRSSRVASDFCSPHMMRYLDIELATQVGETFYDAAIVGVDLSRRLDAKNGKAVAQLELRVLGAFHDRGMVLGFDDVSRFSAEGLLAVRSPDIHWIEFVEHGDGRRCVIHFTSVARTIEIDFQAVSFEVVSFSEARAYVDFERS